MSEAEPHQRAGLALGLTLGTLIASNVVANVLLPSGWYVPWNLGVGATLLWISLRIGELTWSDVGLGPDRTRRGVRWGAALGGLVIGAIAITTALPATRGWFDDDVAAGGQADVLRRVLVVIPFGTVIMEELAFRGCLPALLDLRPTASPSRTAVISAVLFGLWHVLPSRGLADRNATMDSTFGDTLGQWAPIAAAVVATTVAGFALLWVRRRSDSVIAPMLVHFALNAASTLAAWVVS